MIKVYIFFSVLLLNSTIALGQEAQEERDWAIGVSIPINVYERAFEAQYFDASGRTQPYHFAYSYFSLSGSFKGYSMNVLIGVPDGQALPFNDVSDQSNLPWVASVNAGYQYSTNKLKPGHNLNMVYGGFIGFDNFEIAVGLESKSVRVMISGVYFNPAWKPNWYRENFEPDMYFHDPNSFYRRDPLIFQCKVQYKFRLRGRDS